MRITSVAGEDPITIEVTLIRSDLERLMTSGPVVAAADGHALLIQLEDE
jgi:hypothetical protein